MSQPPDARSSLAPIGRPSRLHTRLASDRDEPPRPSRNPPATPLFEPALFEPPFDEPPALLLLPPELLLLPPLVDALPPLELPPFAPDCAPPSPDPPLLGAPLAPVAPPLPEPPLAALLPPEPPESEPVEEQAKAPRAMSPAKTSDERSIWAH